MPTLERTTLLEAYVPFVLARVIKGDRMSILLEEKEIDEIADRYALRPNYAEQLLVKETGKKILIELQAIYNLPDEGMFHKKMGEFIQSLMGEVE